jgi:hypothetical protein
MMGLLSGVGPAQNGLFARPDTGDAFRQAQAFLGGDYDSGIGIAGRRFERRRRDSAFDKAMRSNGAMVGIDPDAASAVALPPIGGVLDDHYYLGGDPGQKGSWRPLSDSAIAAGGAVPDAFGRWE